MTTTTRAEQVKRHDADLGHGITTGAADDDPCGPRLREPTATIPDSHQSRLADRRAERRAYLTIAATLPPSTVSTAPVVRSMRARATKASATSLARTSAPSRLPAM